METKDTRILIYSSDTDTIDAIFDLCELSRFGGLRLVSCRDRVSLNEQLDHFSTAIVFIDFKSFPETDQLNDIALRTSPKPTLAIIPHLEKDALVRALRNGADGVFSLDEIRTNALSLVESLDRQIDRAHTIDAARFLRDSLSQSLDELQADQDAAAQIQQRLLPPLKQSFDHQLLCEYILRPSLLLSGDFVDTLPLNNGKYLVYLADVSGHGASSALVTVMLKNIMNRLLRSYAAKESDILEKPSELLAHINREMLLTSFGKHMTMLVGVIDCIASKLVYSIGGHHPRPVIVQGGQPVFLEGRGMPVGLFEDPYYEANSVDLNESFSFFMFSDGILELLMGDNLEDKEQNLLTLCQAPNLTPASMLKKAVGEGSDWPDDVAIMMVSR